MITPEKEFEEFLIDNIPFSDCPTEWDFKVNTIHSVGGFVRDECMGIPSKDLDIVIEERGGAKRLAQWIVDTAGFSNQPFQTGEAYPIWKVVCDKDITVASGVTYCCKGASVDIAETQQETFPSATSRQRDTSFGTLEQDIERRDFTINMLTRNLSNGKICDISGVGLSDLKACSIRCHPNVIPGEIFSADPLRIIRMVRFAVTFGFKIDPWVMNHALETVNRLSIVSMERINAELCKIAEKGNLYHAVRYFVKLNIAGKIFPNIMNDMFYCEHDPIAPFHLEGSVYNHTIITMFYSKPGVIQQFAALLHDVGKPITAALNNWGGISFKGHEMESAKIAEVVLKSLKFDNDTIIKIKFLIENHMRVHGLIKANDKAIRKFIREIGPNMEDLLDLCEADIKATIGGENYIKEVKEKIAHVMQISKDAEELASKKPILNGHEIMKITGCRPGPFIKTVQEMLLDFEDELAVEGKQLTKEYAITVVELTYNER